MIATHGEMRNEAISRMKKWCLLDPVIDDFERGVLNKSEGSGILFWLNDEEKKLVRDFEDRTGGMVYHCVLSQTMAGTMLSILYVSKYKEEWAADNIDIDEAGYTVARVENLSYPECSEMGGIMLKPQNDGLVRVS